MASIIALCDQLTQEDTTTIGGYKESCVALMHKLVKLCRVQDDITAADFSSLVAVERMVQRRYISGFHGNWFQGHTICIMHYLERCKGIMARRMGAAAFHNVSMKVFEEQEAVMRRQAATFEENALFLVNE